MNEKLLSRIQECECFNDLSKEQVHLYALNLQDITLAEKNSCWKILNEEERTRALKFVFEGDQEKFILNRALVKCTLSRYCHNSPNALCFSYGAHGKPYLALYPDLHFNISHTTGWGLLGISFKSSSGVDIELMNPIENLEDLLKQFTTQKEQQWVLEENTYHRFYTLWTAKEALLKAQGIGFLTSSIPELIKTDFPNKSVMTFQQDTYTIWSRVWNEQYMISLCAPQLLPPLKLREY